MRYFAITAIISLATGCRVTQCHNHPKTAKSALETGLSTSIYPNAPYDKHDYPIEKIDLSIKFKREW
jgi:hypothetical protein